MVQPGPMECNRESWMTGRMRGDVDAFTENRREANTASTDHSRAATIIHGPHRIGCVQRPATRVSR